MSNAVSAEIVRHLLAEKLSERYQKLRAFWIFSQPSSPAWLGKLRHLCQFEQLIVNQLKIYDQCSSTSFRGQAYLFASDLPTVLSGKDLSKMAD